jgi:predicted molibdopterin-dependent oxidoreductase YjgC
MIRLVPNHASKIMRSASVAFTFDGQNVDGYEGDTLAAALLRGGHLHLRNAPDQGGERGAFCCMGLCQECAVRIDGQVVEACRTEITQGLTVERAG